MIRVGLHSGGVMTLEGGVLDVTKVTLQDIAFGLSHVTRFGGQVGAFSVAEHSVNMCRWAKLEYRRGHELRALLLHDCAECLGEGDVQRFVKMEYAESLRAYAKLVTEALWNKFCPDAHDWSYYERGVKNVDVAIGSIEALTFGFPHNTADLPMFRRWPSEAVPRRVDAATAEREWLAEWEAAG